MNHLTKKVILLFSSLILLSGCFGSSDETTNTLQEENAEGEVSYTLALPGNWEKINESAYPENIVYAAREQSADINDASFIAVAKEANAQTDDIGLFTKRNIENIRKVSQDFQLIRQESHQNETTNFELIEYTDKNTKTDEFMSFYSLFALPNDSAGGYNITVVYDIDITPQKKEELKNILLSFNTK